MSRENQYQQIVSALSNIEGYNTNKIQVFEDITYHFQDARNIGFSTDFYIQAASIDDLPIALKIIKLSQAEVKRYQDTSDINNLGIEAIKHPHPAGFNIWREVECLETLSPDKSGIKHYPYFYGYFMCEWADVMVVDYNMHDSNKNPKYKKYLKSREETEICIILVMELFDMEFMQWTNRRHSFSEWKDMYHQMLTCIENLQHFDIVHNDCHDKNFLIKKDQGQDLLVLVDFGSAISSKFKLSTSEIHIYKQLVKSNRDLSLACHMFSAENIAMQQFLHLKRIDTIDKLRGEYPDLILGLEKKIKKKPDHTLYWWNLAEVMAHNLEYFQSYIDEQKLLPSSLSDWIEQLSKKIKKSKTEMNFKNLHSQLKSLRQ